MELLSVWTELQTLSALTDRRVVRPCRTELLSLYRSVKCLLRSLTTFSASIAAKRLVRCQVGLN